MDKTLLNRTDHQGAKGPVFFGKDKILVYIRDNKTDYFPGYLDFPGGGKEGEETVFQTFAREVKEEFGLDIQPDQIKFVKFYPHTRFPGELAYFVVASLPETDISRIKFGDEGVSFKEMYVKEFLASKKAAPALQERLLEYLTSELY